MLILAVYLIYQYNVIIKKLNEKTGNNEGVIQKLTDKNRSDEDVINELTDEKSSNEMLIKVLRNRLRNSEIECTKYKNVINELTDENRSHERLIRVLRDRLENTEIECTEYKVVRYYIILKKINGSTYTLPADVLVSMYTEFGYELQSDNFRTSDSKFNSYILLKAYYPNSGEIHFSKEIFENDYEPQLLKKNESVRIYDVSGREYFITLTDRIVESNIVEINNIRSEKKKFDNHMQKTFSDLRKLRDEIIIDYPYFADIIADYEKLTNDKYAYELKNKSRPAVRAAKILKENSAKMRDLVKENKMLKYQQDIYEAYFPFLAEYKEVSKEDYKEIKKEHSTKEQNVFDGYLSPEEFRELSASEKCQRSLDMYIKKKKSSWQIGREYERYIGYVYENKGYSVEYFGANKGYDDLGRDLIAKNEEETLIVQCKYWNEHKTVHEKHVFQLFGTVFEYRFNHQDDDVKAVFVTSTTLSEVALKFAEALDITVLQNVKYDKSYPRIKCNINGRTGEKIFHLPFDQQYDKIRIERDKGECYVKTVAEAEEQGFRHAYKHNFN